MYYTLYGRNPLPETYYESRITEDFNKILEPDKMLVHLLVYWPDSIRDKLFFFLWRSPENGILVLQNHVLTVNLIREFITYVQPNLVC